jgi:hypothetical protein
MKEQGALLSLRDEEGPVGDLAQQAYFEIMNPKVLAGGSIAKEQAEDDNP